MTGNCEWCEEVLDRVDQRMHPECLVRVLLGSAAHQLGDCSCSGGTREDPPDVTRREAAKLAYDTFWMLRGRASVRRLRD